MPWELLLAVLVGLIVWLATHSVIYALVGFIVAALVAGTFYWRRY